MKVLRFVEGARVLHGIVDDEGVHICDGTLLTGLAPTGDVRDIGTLTVIAPVDPGKIVGVGLNYRGHAEEHHAELPEQPLIFFKPTSAVIGPGEPILVGSAARRTELEAELVVVIGRTARDVTIREALDHVVGYTCGNDVSERTAQQEDGGWPGRSKGYRTFAPIGPAVETEVSPTARISARLNDRVVQDSRIDDLIFDVPALVSFVSSVVTLEPGDLIFTGTPAGVTPIGPGDTVSISIEGIGSLVNPVAPRSAGS